MKEEKEKAKKCLEDARKDLKAAKQKRTVEPNPFFEAWLETGEDASAASSSSNAEARRGKRRKRGGRDGDGLFLVPCSVEQIIHVPVLLLVEVRVEPSDALKSAPQAGCRRPCAPGFRLYAFDVDFKRPHLAHSPTHFSCFFPPPHCVSSSAVWRNVCCMTRDHDSKLGILLVMSDAQWSSSWTFPCARLRIVFTRPFFWTGFWRRSLLSECALLPPPLYARS